MIEFLIGVICGAGVLAFIALRLAPKKEHRDNITKCSAVGLDMNGKGTASIDAFNARLLREAIEKYEGRA